MRTLIQYPFLIYLFSGLAALSIMVVIDYLLGAEAEHLNAWAILNGLFGRDIGIPDSLAIEKFGLWGAAGLMLAINALLGWVILHLLRLLINFIHLF